MTRYLVEHIDWWPLPINETELSDDFLDWPEADVSNEEDERTHRKKWFDDKSSALEYIRGTKEHKGKWLAKITLQRVEFHDEEINDA